jgi:membrane protein
MISALNLAYRVREARPWFEVRTIALGLTIMISILLFTALFFVLVSSHFVDWLGTELRLRPMVVPIWKTIQWPAVILFVTMSYSEIYYFGPNLKARQWHWVTPGSAFGAFLWLLASVGFRTYLHFFNTFSVSYGSLGALRLLLAWLYVTGLAFLIGGEINAEIERAATGGLRNEHFSNRSRIRFAVLSSLVELGPHQRDRLIFPITRFPSTCEVLLYSSDYATNSALGSGL